jgi:hypothetical protein
MKDMQSVNYGDVSQVCGFEQTYKTAYSHGLEFIYALENVDPRSIRRLSVQNKKNTVSLSTQRPRPCLSKSPQLELDLGRDFREWIHPLILSEPIQVLELTRYAERVLMIHYKKTLANVLHCDFNELMLSKKIGQGHVQEIRDKLHTYLAGKELSKTTRIDFTSFLRCLTGTMARKTVYVFLQNYDLEELLTLLPSEGMEIRRLQEIKRQEWIQAAFEELQMPERCLFVKEKMSEIAAAVLKPWMRSRLGFATAAELLERLECLSGQFNAVVKSLRLFSDLYFNKTFPFAANLYEVCPGVFSIDLWHKEIFHRITTKASSYFYKSSTYYPLDELVRWINRELAKEWEGFPEGYVEKVLSVSSNFHLRKAGNGKVEILLA